MNDKIIVILILFTISSFSSAVFLQYVPGQTLKDDILNELASYALKKTFETQKDILGIAINVTFRWAENHFPFVKTLVDASNSLKAATIDKIPGGKAFLDIMNQATNFHNIQESMDKLNPFKKNPSKSIDEAVKDIQLNHNISLSQIPFVITVPKNISFPALNDLVKDATSANISAVPFASTLLELNNQFKGNIFPIANFTLPSFQIG